MTPDSDPLAAFSQRLDDEWARVRIRQAIERAPFAEETAADVSAELLAADPLGDGSGRRWPAAIRDLLAVWPGRVAVAATVGVVLVVGVLLGRLISNGPAPVTIAVAPPLPAYRPQPEPGLGLVPPTRRESAQKFREGMAQYGQADFVRRALPLLREAATADATNDQAQFWLGVVLLQDGRPHEAVAPLEAAVRLAPADRTYKGFLLYAYLQTGRADRALALQQDLLRPR